MHVAQDNMGSTTKDIGMILDGAADEVSERLHLDTAQEDLDEELRTQPLLDSVRSRWLAALPRVSQMKSAQKDDVPHTT